MPIASRATALLGLLDEGARAADAAIEVADAGRLVLAAVCRATGWPLAHLCLPSPDGGLTSSGIWVRDAEDSGTPREIMAGGRFLPATGLAGQALTSRAPVWTADPAVEPLLARGADLGIAAACAVPAPGVNGLAAVLLFFCADREPPDADLLPVLAAVGAQLGRVADRTQLAALQAAYERERTVVARLIELHRVKDDAIATVSHELRTPLTSIAGYVEMLRDDIEPLSGPQQQMVEAITRNVGRLRIVADDLIVADSMDAGPPALVFAPTPLPDVIKLAVESAIPLAARRNQRIEAHIEPGVELVTADGPQLLRAIAALLSNAVKFSPTGAPVDVHAVSRGPEIDIRVTDRGSGIPAAELDLVFERFYRTELANRQAIQGLGLGLSIARDIVEAHRGRVSAASVLGQGSTFTIHLPALPAGQR